MSQLIKKADIFATRAHAAVVNKDGSIGQLRLYTREPYIVHPRAVAATLANIGESEAVIAAGLLHDVIEDCGVTMEQLREKFGTRVALLVDEVTDVSIQPQYKSLNREQRKKLDRDHLTGASRDGKTIKLADLIDNTKSIVKGDPDFAKIYMREKRLLLPVLTEGNPALWMRAEHQLMEYFS